MAKLNFNKSFFKKKRKQKYPRNKFFTYTNEDRSGKNFNFKDFRNSTSYNSKFNRALFMELILIRQQWNFVDLMELFLFYYIWKL